MDIHTTFRYFSRLLHVPNSDARSRRFVLIRGRPMTTEVVHGPCRHPDPLDHLGLLFYIGRKVLSKMPAQGLELGDLVSEGCPALQRACKRYRADRGSSFGSYAAVSIYR